MGELPVVYPGIHNLALACHLERCMVSANTLIGRVSDFEVRDWMLDSGAFTRISRGKDHLPLHEYAEMAERWGSCGNLQAVVSQDYMCEPFVLEVAGATVLKHQEKTTQRFLDLGAVVDDVYLMPVIQGYTPDEYAMHASEMSPYIGPEAWVGVGSVCKRQGSPDSLAAVLEAVHAVRPDWQLHGFGVKATSMRSGRVARHLATVDSMAWSFSARYRRLKTGEGPGANDIDACRQWLDEVESISPSTAIQTSLPLGR